MYLFTIYLQKIGVDTAEKESLKVSDHMKANLHVLHVRKTNLLKVVRAGFQVRIDRAARRRSESLLRDGASGRAHCRGAREPRPGRCLNGTHCGNRRRRVGGFPRIFTNFRKLHLKIFMNSKQFRLRI